MSDINIRKAKVEDAPEIANIHVQTWQCAYRGKISEDYLSQLDVNKKTAFWREWIAKNDDRTITLVAEVKGKVVGFCDIGPTKEKEDDSGEIFSMYIDSKCLGRGNGSHLMKEILSRFSTFKYKKAYLWVLDTNTSAQHFYEKFGWKLDGITRVEEKRGIKLNELRMTIPLGTF